MLLEDIGGECENSVKEVTAITSCGKNMIGQVITGKQGHTFTVVREIGRGGFGIVYLAEDEKKAPYAVKVIAPVSDPSVRLSFEKEIQSTLGLASENLLAVIDYGECLVGSSRGLFTVMEYCPDGDYRDLLGSYAEKHPAVEEVVSHILQILNGLKVLHTRTIHRDLKPENVLIAGGKLKIGDFGLAKFVDEATRTLTFKGSGTPRYMAPEVWLGAHVVPATDLYALGVMFFEALTGQAPFEAPDTNGLRDLHLYSPIPRAKSVNTDVPELVDGVIKKLLAKSSKDRYQSADEVLAALQTVPRPADSTIIRLADRIRHHHDTAEAETLAHEKAVQQEQDSQARIRYMEQQLLDLIQEVIEELNLQLVETKIARRDSYDGRVYEFQGRELAIHFFSPQELYIDPEVPGRMETLKKRHAVHGGFVEIREHSEDREGWNLVLVRPPGDLYGEWKIVETRLSPLSGRGTRYEPIATNARLFADNLACHWMPAMHLYQLTDKALEKRDIVRILEIFIPKI
jgi:serine/threonine protein kinase